MFLLVVQVVAPHFIQSCIYCPFFKHQLLYHTAVSRHQTLTTTVDWTWAVACTMSALWREAAIIYEGFHAAIIWISDEHCQLGRTRSSHSLIEREIPSWRAVYIARKSHVGHPSTREQSRVIQNTSLDYVFVVPRFYAIWLVQKRCRYWQMFF